MIHPERDDLFDRENIKSREDFIEENEENIWLKRCKIERMWRIN